jgi:hypothetical protein
LEIPNETDAGRLKFAALTGNVAIQLITVNEVEEELVKKIVYVIPYWHTVSGMFFAI